MTVLPDYVIVARAGAWFGRMGLGFGALTPQRLEICRRIGRGRAVEPMEMDACMGSASIFWFLTGFTAMLSFFVSLVAIGSIFGKEALYGPLLLIPGLALGLFVFAASSYGFAIVRSMNLRDGIIIGRGGSRSQSFTSSRALPKPRDSVISLVLGIVGALLVFVLPST